MDLGGKEEEDWQALDDSGVLYRSVGRGKAQSEKR